MSGRNADKNMLLKARKVKKYDVEAFRVRTCEDIIQDAHLKTPSPDKYIIVRDDGKFEFFATHAAMTARKQKIESRVIYARTYEGYERAERVYVVTTKRGKRLRFYGFSAALNRLNEKDAVKLTSFPDMQVITVSK